jgi:hypothetical protein
MIRRNVFTFSALKALVIEEPDATVETLRQDLPLLREKFLHPPQIILVGCLSSASQHWSLVMHIFYPYQVGTIIDTLHTALDLSSPLFLRTPFPRLLPNTVHTYSVACDREDEKLEKLLRILDAVRNQESGSIILPPTPPPAIADWV